MQTNSEVGDRNREVRFPPNTGHCHACARSGAVRRPGAGQEGFQRADVESGEPR